MLQKASEWVLFPLTFAGQKRLGAYILLAVSQVITDKRSETMKFSFSTLGCPDWPLEKVVSEAKRLGYDGVEIRGVKRVFDLSKAPEFARGEIERTRKLFESAGVSVVSIDSSSSFCSPDAANQEAAFDEAVRHIDIAAAMGARIMRVFGGNIPEGEPREKWAKILADSLRRVGKAAAGKDVSVAIESHDSWARCDELVPVVKAVGSKNVRILWDMGNSFAKGESFAEGAPLVRDYVVHVHIKDHTADGKEAMLGKGVVPLADALKTLKSIGFDGYVSLEWEKAWHPEIEDPEVALPQAIRFLRALDQTT